MCVCVRPLLKWLRSKANKFKLSPLIGEGKRRRRRFFDDHSWVFIERVLWCVCVWLAHTTLQSVIVSRFLLSSFCFSTLSAPFTARWRGQQKKEKEGERDIWDNWYFENCKLNHPSSAGKALDRRREKRVQLQRRMGTTHTVRPVGWPFEQLMDSKQTVKG